MSQTCGVETEVYGFTQTCGRPKGHDDYHASDNLEWIDAGQMVSEPPRPCPATDRIQLADRRWLDRVCAFTEGHRGPHGLGPKEPLPSGRVPHRSDCELLSARCSCSEPQPAEYKYVGPGWRAQVGVLEWTLEEILGGRLVEALDAVFPPTPGWGK